MPQPQLSQNLVSGMTWWHLGQRLLSACRGEFLSLAATQCSHAPSVLICSAVARTGVPSVSAVRHSKCPQSGWWRILGGSPVGVPSRWTGCTTYLMSGCMPGALTTAAD
jgi:hypothetical protein